MTKEATQLVDTPEESIKVTKLQESEMFALELASLALGKISGAKEGVRFLSVRIDPVRLADKVEETRTLQQRLIELEIKLRNPFGDRPNIANVHCFMVQSADPTSCRLKGWSCGQVQVFTNGGKSIYQFNARDLGL